MSFWEWLENNDAAMIFGFMLGAVFAGGIGALCFLIPKALHLYCQL